ncbi:MAG TPA: type II toxin-antitoxin system VapC family toxin [Gammaproteobacteria bacterium]|jgi:predicted nucleic acid-binding protein|nr:type II toxin-antitoxin system VapC family toxin [Gammaproteobacteria bacterium]
MGLILDTCIFIQAEKQNVPMNFDQWQADEEVHISVITAAELLMGVHRANTEARRIKRSAFVEGIINEIPIIDFTIEVCRIHAEVYSYLAQQGQLIGAHDLIIAATALTYGHALLTTNQREFNRVPGLTVFSV